jgi:two-component system, sensor histidine kinase and response regulator
LTTAAGVSQGPPSILLVDDNPANLKLLSGMLKKTGYRVRPVPSGDLALEAARVAPPDLVLMDVNMPGMDGYEVCRRLKADEALRHIPVIFISALDETPDKMKAFAAGGVDYVTKPFQFEEVEARVTAHLEIERQKRELQESYDKLRELEALRDGLVHMIVHDMRSPLTGISACLQALEMMERENLPERSLRLLSEARTTSAKLIEMVSCLLDVSKMEANAMELKLARCDLASVVKSALGEVEQLKGRRNLHVELPETPAVVLCDGELVQRVVQNLLANAFQFTPDGTAIVLSVERRGDGVRVAVRDEGPGIPQQHHGRVFEKFGQVEAREAHHKHTTGLGLTFCKLAVEAHGGTIGVDSDGEHGSTFWFTLPGEGPKAPGEEETPDT